MSRAVGITAARASHWRAQTHRAAPTSAAGQDRRHCKIAGLANEWPQSISTRRAYACSGWPRVAPRPLQCVCAAAGDTVSCTVSSPRADRRCPGRRPAVDDPHSQASPLHGEGWPGRKSGCAGRNDLHVGRRRRRHHCGAQHDGHDRRGGGLRLRGRRTRTASRHAAKRGNRFERRSSANASGASAMRRGTTTGRTPTFQQAESFVREPEGNGVANADCCGCGARDDRSAPCSKRTYNEQSGATRPPWTITVPPRTLGQYRRNGPISNDTVTPNASTRSRSSGLPNLAMPQTSFVLANSLAIGKATWPAGPVMRIFSPASSPTPPGFWRGLFCAKAESCTCQYTTAPANHPARRSSCPLGRSDPSRRCLPHKYGYRVSWPAWR